MLDQYHDTYLLDAIYANSCMRKNLSLDDIHRVYEIAKQLAKQYPDPFATMKQYGFIYTYKTSVSNTIFHAQCIYEQHCKVIEINELWIQRYLAYMSKEDALLLHLAHESFHILEENEEVANLFSFHKYKNIFLEIGAHAYAREIVKCAHHPQYYELLYRCDAGISCEKDIEFYVQQQITSMIEKGVQQYERIYRNHP